MPKEGLRRWKGGSIFRVLGWEERLNWMEKIQQTSRSVVVDLKKRGRFWRWTAEMEAWFCCVRLWKRREPSYWLLPSSLMKMRKWKIMARRRFILTRANLKLNNDNFSLVFVPPGQNTCDLRPTWDGTVGSKYLLIFLYLINYVDKDSDDHPNHFINDP